MRSELNIRMESAYDVPAIHAVHVASFPTSLEADLVDLLRDAGRLHVSLVAELAGEVVGHVAFSPVYLGGMNEGVGLAPVAVRSDYRRRGIADRLICAGLVECDNHGDGFVVVLGDPAYYARFGFRPASSWALEDEYGGGDAFQAIELRPGSIPDGGGLVRYAPELAAADRDS